MVDLHSSRKAESAKPAGAPPSAVSAKVGTGHSAQRNVSQPDQDPSRVRDSLAHASASHSQHVSTKKRLRPTSDLAEPEIDDAALRKAMGKKTPARSKAPFKNYM